MIGAAIALGLGVLPVAVAGAAPTQEDAAALRNVRQRQSDASMLQNEARNRVRAEAQRAAATGQIAVEETERPKLDLPDTLKVQVNGFKITGQDVIPEPELQLLLADKKGRLLTFKDLQEGADTLPGTSGEKGTWWPTPICRYRKSMTALWNTWLPWEPWMALPSTITPASTREPWNGEPTS